MLMKLPYSLLCPIQRLGQATQIAAVRYRTMVLLLYGVATHGFLGMPVASSLVSNGPGHTRDVADTLEHLHDQAFDDLMVEHTSVHPVFTGSI
jgi:hypothetical protein